MGVVITVLSGAIVLKDVIDEAAGEGQLQEEVRRQVGGHGRQGVDPPPLALLLLAPELIPPSSRHRNVQLSAWSQARVI